MAEPSRGIVTQFSARHVLRQFRLAPASVALVQGLGREPGPAPLNFE
jgi:hypothetical protein